MKVTTGFYQKQGEMREEYDFSKGERGRFYRSDAEFLLPHYPENRGSASTPLGIIPTMPTVLRIGAYRFFFYAGDREEPPHIHVERDAHVAKFWLAPVRLQNSGGFNRREISHIQRLVEEHEETLQRSWDEFFAG